MIYAKPITQKQAKIFVDSWHRHHIAPIGSIFQIAAYYNDILIGVAMCGRPVARGNDNKLTIEVTRCCILDEYSDLHVASFLYSRCRRIARELGYRRIITYTLISEWGTSLEASGWHRVKITNGGSWNCKSRPRIDKHPTEEKVLWESIING